jgi:zinc transporter 1/2/3
MGLEAIKSLLTAAVLLAGLAGGHLALRSARSAGATNRLGHANAFASGVILGVGLLHMLPDAHRSLGAIYPDYPVAFLLAALAFFTLLLVEHVLLQQRGHHHGELAPHGQHELADEVAVHASEHHLASYVLMAGLSVHSVVTGVALGAQTQLGNTLTIFAALLCHKSTEGFALGVSLARNHVNAALSSSLVLAFALATPLGMAIGAIASQLLEVRIAAMFEAVFSAVAGGTFIYIASLDMIGEEFSHGDRPLAKWLWATVGLALTAVLASRA